MSPVLVTCGCRAYHPKSQWLRTAIILLSPKILPISWAQMGDSSAPCDNGCICRHLGYQLGGTFKMAQSSVWHLGRVDQKAGLSWNPQKSKSQLLRLSYYMATQDSPKHRGK